MSIRKSIPSLYWTKVQYTVIASWVRGKPWRLAVFARRFVAAFGFIPRRSKGAKFGRVVMKGSEE
jgi:hypothetical protein